MGKAGDTMAKFDLNKYRLRIRMIVINLALAIIPLLIFGVITYGVFINNSNRVMTETIDLTFEQMSGRLDEYFENINTVAKVFYFDDDLQQILYEDPELENFRSKTEIQNQLNNIFLMNSTIENSYMVTKGGQLVGTGSLKLDFDINELIQTARQSNKSIVFMAVPGPENQDIIAAVKPLRYVKTLEDLGTGVILINKRKLSDMIERNAYGSKLEIMLLDSTGSPIILPESNVKVPINQIRENDQNGIDTFKTDGKKYRFSRHISDATGWELVAVVSLNDLYKDSIILAYSILFYIILTLVLVLVITIMTNFQITKPIVMLAEAINKVASGDLKQKIYFEEKNEITSIADNFNYMVSEIKALTRKIFTTQQRLYESELEKKMFQVNLLQSQINSHFLYNTLSTIRAMAKKGAVDEVSEMISHLVKMLRYASVLDEKVLLKNEFSNVNDYFYIQRMRIGDQLNLQLESMEDLLECEVPKMLLQPVVENSILHGFGAKGGRWMIKISVQQKQKDLFVYVIDNGNGIDRSALEQINESLKNKKSMLDTEEPKSSIGLRNIQNRIHTLYGPDYGIRVRSWKTIGTVVEIRIPFKRGG